MQHFEVTEGIKGKPATSDLVFALLIERLTSFHKSAVCTRVSLHSFIGIEPKVGARLHGRG